MRGGLAPEKGGSGCEIEKSRPPWEKSRNRMGFLRSRHTPSRQVRRDMGDPSWRRLGGGGRPHGPGISLPRSEVGPEGAAHTTRYFQNPVPKYLDPMASQGLVTGDVAPTKDPLRVPNRDLRTQTPAHFGQKVKFISPASEFPHPLVTDNRRDLRSRPDDTTLTPNETLPTPIVRVERSLAREGESQTDRVSRRPCRALEGPRS